MPCYFSLNTAYRPKNFRSGPPSETIAHPYIKIRSKSPRSVLNGVYRQQTRIDSIRFDFNFSTKTITSPNFQNSTRFSFPIFTQITLRPQKNIDHPIEKQITKARLEPTSRIQRATLRPPSSPRPALRPGNVP